MSQDTEREAFEAWVNEQPEAKGMHKKWWCRQIDDGGYSCHEPDVMWRAWQARAALSSQQAAQGEPLYGFSREQLEDMRLRFAVMSDFYSKMAVELIDEVLASPPSREPQWQPIETAPKDGSEFLVFKPTTGMLVVTYLDSDHPDYDGDTPHVTWDHDSLWDPTHWMPLPPPPGIGTEGGEHGK